VRQLFVDLDGVLADFDRHYYEQFGIKTDRNAPEPPGFWTPIEQHGAFFATMPVIPDALRLWEGAKRLHPNPIILTGIPRIENVQEHKRGWVHQHIDPHATVICCRSKDKRKHGKPGDVLVDDWHKYRHLWEEMGGVFVLHTSATASLCEVASIFGASAKSCDDPFPGACRQ
jgi:5'(3')-deoxyribonucleotidase